MKTRGEVSLLADAGRLVDRHAMAWVRRLSAPLDRAWEAISTQDGLARWWGMPIHALELRVGGAFNHHWNNTVTAFKEGEYIDFAEPKGSYAGTGGLRFELRPHREATMFTLLCTWHEGSKFEEEGPQNPLAHQPGGPGTPWIGVAAGWHSGANSLRRLFDANAPAHSYEDLCRFYAGHLEDMYRWHGMVQREPPLGPDKP